VTPYYEDGAVVIYHGDCAEVLPDIPDESVDIVVTSPPYNMGLTPGGNGRGMYKHTTSKGKRFHAGYDATGDDMDPDEYNAFHRAQLAEMWRITRLAVFWNHRPRVIHGHLQDPLGNDFGIPVRQRIVLDRGTGIDVSLRQFCTRGEYLYLFAKPAFILGRRRRVRHGRRVACRDRHGSTRPPGAARRMSQEVLDFGLSA
jgi:hypothetical protein